MLEYLELFKQFTFTGQMGFWTYWLPLILCAIGYTGRTWVHANELRNPSDKWSYKYSNPITVGTIIGRILLTVTPCVNVIALVFGLSYDMLGSIFKWVGTVLEFELVKKRT